MPKRTTHNGTKSTESSPPTLVPGVRIPASLRLTSHCSLPSDALTVPRR